MTDVALNPELLKIAEDITLAELIETELTREATIRFICGIRKSLLQLPAEMAGNSDLTELEKVVSQIYHQIGYDRRSEAFSHHKYAPARLNNDHHPAANPFSNNNFRPIPVVLEQAVQQQPLKTAERFIRKTAIPCIKLVLDKWTAEDKVTFTFSEIKAAVEKEYLDDNKVWDPKDLEDMGSYSHR